MPPERDPTASLYEIHSKFAAADNEVTLKDRLTIVAQLMDLARVELCTPDEAGNQLVTLAETDLKNGLLDDMENCEAFETISVRVAKTGSAEIEQNIRTFGCFPLRVPNKTLGVLKVFSSRSLSSSDSKEISIVADLLASLLESQSLKNLYSAARNDLGILSEIYGLGSGQLPTNELLDMILTVMIDSAGADSGAILFVDRDQFVVRGSNGKSDGESIHQSSVINEAAAGRVLRDKKPLVINSVSDYSLAQDSTAASTRVKTILAAPLISGASILGVAQVDFFDERHLSKPEIERFQMIAEWAASAVERRQLNSEIERSREALKDLAAKQTDRVESERRRLSRELHDQAGQSLTAILIRLDLISEKITDESVKQQLQQIELLARKQ